MRRVRFGGIKATFLFVLSVIFLPLIKVLLLLLLLLNSFAPSFRSFFFLFCFGGGGQFVRVATDMNFSEFPRVDGSRLKNGRLMEELDRAVDADIPRLMESLPGMTGAGANKMLKNARDAEASAAADEEGYK